MVEVVVTDEFREWYEALGDRESDAIYERVELLKDRGLSLGDPYTSQIKGTKHPLRELKVQVAGHPIRIFYAFDPQRQAVLLIGGDKTGQPRFYEIMVPRAEKLWVEYLTETER